MATTGACTYNFNAHEVYVKPDMGFTCGATTYALEDRETPDPWCPTHGGTPDPSEAAPAIPPTVEADSATTSPTTEAASATTSPTTEAAPTTPPTAE